MSQDSSTSDDESGTSQSSEEEEEESFSSVSNPSNSGLNGGQLGGRVLDEEKAVSHYLQETDSDFPTSAVTMDSDESNSSSSSDTIISSDEEAKNKPPTSSGDRNMSEYLKYRAAIVELDPTTDVANSEPISALKGWSANCKFYTREHGKIRRVRLLEPEFYLQPRQFQVVKILTRPIRHSVPSFE